MKNFMLCLLNVALLVCGQLLFKLAVRNKEITTVSDAVSLLFSPYMISAIVLYVGTTFLWVYILTKVHLSYAYPIQALAFPLVVFFSFLLYNEDVPIQRWIGIGVIVLGAIIASR